MKSIEALFHVDDQWFYSNPHPLLRLLTVYVKGDMIVLLPFVALIGLVGFFSISFMCLMYALFYTVRSFGEMNYWISQQFGAKRYRPHDLGFKKAGNDAIYILYQLIALGTTVLGLGMSVWIIIYWMI